MNSIIHGDCLEVMRGIPSASVDLIYADPPFNSGRDYEGAAGAFSDTWGNEEAALGALSGDVRAVAELAGRINGRAMRAYLAFMGARLLECSRVLAPNGSIYVHCDPNGNSYLRILMDAIFGENNFRRELVWSMPPPSGFKCQANNWIRGHDTMLYYALADFTFHKEYLPYSAEHLARFDREEGGEKYWLRAGKKRRLGKGVMVSSCWTDIPSMQTQSMSAEQGIGYPTGKPLEVSERVIAASSNTGDVVLDPFVGSGTTAVAARRLNRKWIGIDRSEEAVTLARERLAAEPPVQDGLF